MFPVHIGKDCTPHKLIESIATALNHPVHELRVSYAGVELSRDDHTRLQHKPACSVVHVVKRMRGGGGCAPAELAKQMKSIMKNPLPGISVGPSDADPLIWYAKVNGAEGSPYAGGWFDVRLKFPSDFPISFPWGKFLTPVWHPNVSTDGRICISQARVDETKCAVECVLVSLRMLLATPNPDSPLNSECARQFKYDYEEYKKKAAAMTRAYAM
eukprot:gene7024-7238_t